MPATLESTINKQQAVHNSKQQHSNNKKKTQQQQQRNDNQYAALPVRGSLAMPATLEMIELSSTSTPALQL
jgi:hypothetical protein